MANNVPSVAVIVLNWNNWWDTIECLNSMQNLEYRNYCILIVDNGSGNDSQQRIQDWISSVRGEAKTLDMDSGIPRMARLLNAGGKNGSPDYFLLGLKENLGYAGGNNAAIDIAQSAGFRYIWLLNNDTIVMPDSLQKLVVCAEHDSRTGMVASRLVNIFSDRPLPEIRVNFKSRCLESDSVKGASILVKSDCFRDIGLIDEKYFCYFEDLDLSFRARQNGWKLFYDVRSIVFHKWGSSAGSLRIEKKFLTKTVMRVAWSGFQIPGYYEARNGIYFIKKNRPFLFVPYAIIRTLHLFFQIYIYDDHKWGRTKIIAKGAWDGILGRMGKADISS